MKRLATPWMVGVVVIIALAAGAIVTRRWQAHSQEAVHARYYCPMHPTYISDKPGECPICQMTLVKDDRATGVQGSTSFGSICYLHNCSKLHGGKPCPMTVLAKPGEKVTCPICGTHVAEAQPNPSQRKILYWTDPMIPGYKADAPGKSPMGMDLVPVYAEEAGAGISEASPSGYAPVLLTPQKQQLIGVRTAPVQKRAMTKTIRTVGRIAYDPDLYQTEAEYLESLRALEQATAAKSTEGVAQAQRLADASRMKLRLMGLSQELIDEMAGWAGPDKSLLLSDAQGHVWLYAPIYEYELPFVKAGQTVRVEVPAEPARALEGTIRSVDPVLDPMTRSAKVRAVLTAPEGLLKPEMYVNAVIEIPLGDVLGVSEEAVFNTGTKQIVFVDQGQGLFEPREVTVGSKVEGFIEIRTGVSEGESVVTSGNFLIDSESRLKAALEGAARQEQSHEH